MNETKKDIYSRLNGFHIEQAKLSSFSAVLVRYSPVGTISVLPH